MNESVIPNCPLSGKPCKTKACIMWQRYSRVYFSLTGDMGDCLLKLAVDGIVEKYCPGLKEERFFDPNDETDTLVEVPF